MIGALLVVGTVTAFVVAAVGWLVSSEWKLPRRRFARAAVVPIARAPCAVYRVVVEDREGRSNQTLVDESKVVDFLLEDVTGVALVSARALGLMLVGDAHYSSGVFHAPPPEVRAFLAARDIEPKSTFGLNRSLSTIRS